MSDDDKRRDRAVPPQEPTPQQARLNSQVTQLEAQEAAQAEIEAATAARIAELRAIRRPAEPEAPSRPILRAERGPGGQMIMVARPSVSPSVPTLPDDQNQTPADAPLLDLQGIQQRAARAAPTARAAPAAGATRVPGLRSGAAAVPEAEPAVPLTPEEQALADKQASVRYLTPEEQSEANISSIFERQVKDLNQGANELAAERDLGTETADDFARRIVDRYAEEYDRVETALEENRQKMEALYAQRLDPARIFNQGSGASVFSAHLGVAVGAMLQAFGNQMFPGSNMVNTSLNLVNQAIENDIQAQNANFQRGVQGLHDNMSAMELARQNGLSDIESMEFARIRALEHTESRLASIAQSHQGTQQSLEFEKLAESFRLQAAQRRTALNLLQQQSAVSGAGTGRGRRQIGHSVVGWETDPSNEEGNAAWARMTEEQRQEKLDQMDAVGSASSLLQQLARLTAEGRAGQGIHFSASDRQAAESLRMLATFELKEMLKAGTLDEGLITAMDAILGSNSGWVDLTTAQLAAINNTLSFLRRKATQLGRRVGARPNMADQMLTVDGETLITGRTAATPEERAAPASQSSLGTESPFEPGGVLDRLNTFGNQLFGGE